MNFKNFYEIRKKYMKASEFYIYISDSIIAEKYETYIRGFIDEHKTEIRKSQQRNKCHIVPFYFERFMKHIERESSIINNIDIKIADGAYKVDKALYKKADFTKDELKEMKLIGLDPNNKDHREKYAKDKSIEDEMFMIPHYWNLLEGAIIDFTSVSQFVKSGLTDEIKEENYYPNYKYPSFSN